MIVVCFELDVPIQYVYIQSRIFIGLWTTGISPIIYLAVLLPVAWDAEAKKKSRLLFRM